MPAAYCPDVQAAQAAPPVEYCPAGHAVQAVPVHAPALVPLAPQVHVPPPSKPSLQVTEAVAPVLPLSAVPDSLKDLDIELLKTGELKITYRNSETGIGRLLEKVREAGIGVADLSTDQPKLEDVFVAMTTETA